MHRYFFICLSLLLVSVGTCQQNYHVYHAEVIACEQLIAAKEFSGTIKRLDTLFKTYDFLFLREIKLATALCVYEEDVAMGLRFIRMGMAHGWTLKEIRKERALRFFKKQTEWENIVSEYDSLHAVYTSRINQEVRLRLHQLFKKDQKKALGALLRIGNKAQERYAEEKFAPHSEQQLQTLSQILTAHGYPGEQLIGNNLWASVILSHHNSISFNYNSKDTLYQQLRPVLIKALGKGEISPYEYAQIADWRAAALSGHASTEFGFIGKVKNVEALEAVNLNRMKIGMRSIALRNQLVDLEKTLGMNFYLPKGWQNGKIGISGDGTP